MGNMHGHTYLNICTYNTRTLTCSRTEEVLETLMDEFKEFKWEVIGLAETKREGQGIDELQGGIWFTIMEKQKKIKMPISDTSKNNRICQRSKKLLK